MVDFLKAWDYHAGERGRMQNNKRDLIANQVLLEMLTQDQSLAWQALVLLCLPDCQKAANSRMGKSPIPKVGWAELPAVESIIGTLPKISAVTLKEAVAFETELRQAAFDKVFEIFGKELQANLDFLRKQKPEHR